MSLARHLVPAAAVLLLGASEPGHAMTQVSGPIQIGPSQGDPDDQDHAAQLSTTITNQGTLPDRLINAACPGSGHVALLNGSMRQYPNGQYNGLDIPAATGGQYQPVQAQFSLTQATQPMVRGALVPCTVSFEHGGQRIIVFSIGIKETQTDEP
ncbi:copper chaperone PCu(A)C [Lichenicoccus roseus]|uniref:Copper chaperone PCu(A)C n=1 Tax=Lichenicoccus roseus TaxID=2683649 RepID=A0A5R9J9Y4_9PROT|nr:copper chaperone PCu(A)C [Lichenicoccus roseus]